MDRVPLDLDKLALALGRAQIENLALQQQLDAAHEALASHQQDGSAVSYPLEMDHDRVPGLIAR